MDDFNEYINYIQIEKEILHLNRYSQIDNQLLLDEIIESCYTNEDLRASWIGSGLPMTKNKEMKSPSLPYTYWSTWALEHWAMYSGFLDSINDRNGNYRILDMGCGIGHATSCLSTIFKNSNIDAIDLDKDCINFANKYNKNININYIDCSFENFNNNLYDYIFALEIYEHLPPESHVLFMEKVFSLIKPGGLIFFTTPNSMNEKDANRRHGHIGVLNYDRFNIFVNRYKEHIVESEFYDNLKLKTCCPTEFIVKEPLCNFMQTERNKSHFKIIFKV